MSSNASENSEPITITDKRRCDPETGQVRVNDSVSPPEGGTPNSDEQPTPSDCSSDDQDVAPHDDPETSIAELTADLQRVQADFANYRKRALRDQQAAITRAKASVIGELLGILDDLDRARSHGDLDSGPFKAIADKLHNTLSGLGLSSFGQEGDLFDPQLHEAVQHDGEGTHSVVGTVMRSGYKFGEHILRHAMVGVVDQEQPDQTANTETANPETT